MADVSEDGGALSPTGEASNGHSTFLDWTPTAMQLAPLMVSGSFKEGKSSSRRRTSMRLSMDADEFINLLHGSDPLGFSRMVCFAKNCERPPEFAGFQSCWVFTNIDFLFLGR